MALKRLQRTYTVDEKLEVLGWLRESTLADVAAETGIPYETVRTWSRNETRIRSFKGSKTRKTTGGQGRKELVPFTSDLVMFMKDTRRNEEVLSSVSMINFMKQHHSPWLQAYLARSKTPDSGYRGLMRLCQRFSHR
ncbi:hypothetical protein PINS_up019103, partial [Pythium insidiosum]